MNTTVYGIFIASLFLGENATIPAFVLANQGYVDVKTVVIFTYLASLFADIFWYVVARFFFKKFDLEKWYNHTNISNKRIYRFVLDKHIFFSVTFIKFLVGLRLILTLALILIKKFSFKKYFVFSVLSNVFLIAGLYILGRLVSYGFNFLPIYKNATGIIAIIIISLLLIHIVPVAIKMYLSKKQVPEKLG